MLRAIVLALVAIAFVHAPSARAEAPPQERYSILEMDGRRVGWIRTAESVEPSGDLQSESEMRLAFSRGAARIELSMESRFVESPDGAPRSMQSVQRLGAVPVTTRYAFTDDGVVITTEQAGQSSTARAPLPAGEWMPPARAARFVESQLASGARSFSVRTIDPLVGLMPVEASYTIDGPATVEAFGKTVPAIRWLVKPNFPPGAESVEYVDERGEPIRSEIAMGAIRMTVLAADKELALAPFEPAEIMASTLVTPSGARIAAPRTTTRASFIVSIDDDDLPDMPTQGPQRFERLDAHRARVVVDLAAPAAAPAEERDDPAFREPSPAIDSADPVIRDLASNALDAAGKAGASAAERAEALRLFVHRHLSLKSLGVGFATASEAARAREGDCTEHAMLLAALLRAHGIPARVVSGLVYMDEFLGQDRVFGYHMWTQALLETDGAPRWTDLDAALGSDRPTDATHIAIAVTAMKPGETLNSMVALAPLLGRLQIEVESAAP